VLVQRQRDEAAALKLLRKLLKRQGFAPTVIVTDNLRSYGAAFMLIGFSGRHEHGLRKRPGDDGSERCSASSRRHQLSASSPSTPSSTTSSTSNDTSSDVPSSGGFELRLTGHGTTRLLPRELRHRRVQAAPSRG
jgi:hypothetical protein